MDYIITDRITSPPDHADHYSEKFAYMPSTFFIGDHRQMFPHMAERALLPHGSDTIKDNVSIINATDLAPLVSRADSVAVSWPS